MANITAKRIRLETESNIFHQIPKDIDALNSRAFEFQKAFDEFRENNPVASASEKCKYAKKLDAICPASEAIENWSLPFPPMAFDTGVSLMCVNAQAQRRLTEYPTVFSDMLKYSCNWDYRFQWQDVSISINKSASITENSLAEQFKDTTKLKPAIITSELMNEYCRWLVWSQAKRQVENGLPLTDLLRKTGFGVLALSQQIMFNCIVDEKFIWADSAKESSLIASCGLHPLLLFSLRNIYQQSYLAFLVYMAGMEYNEKSDILICAENPFWVNIGEKFVINVKIKCDTENAAIILSYLNLSEKAWKKQINLIRRNCKSISSYDRLYYSIQTELEKDTEFFSRNNIPEMRWEASTLTDKTFLKCPEFVKSAIAINFT